MPKRLQIKGSIEETAAKFGVSKVAVRAWVHEGLAIHNHERLAKLLLGRPKLMPKVRARCEQILGEPQERLPDAESLIKSTDATDPAANIGDLERWKALFAARLERAIRIGNRGDISFFSKQLVTFDHAIRHNRLMVARLGIDQGELLARDEVVRLIRCVASAIAVGIQRFRDTVPPSLTQIADPVEIRHRITGPAIAGFLVGPFRRARNSASGANVPGWAVDAFTGAIGDLVEDGEQHMQEEE